MTTPLLQLGRPSRENLSAPPTVVAVEILRVQGTSISETTDRLAIEEPLEICVVSGSSDQRRRITLTTTMRTPGNDVELAAGLLFAEGIIHHTKNVQQIEPCGPPIGPGGTTNTVRVELSPDFDFDAKMGERHLTTSSACGVCGKTTLDSLKFGTLDLAEENLFAPEMIHSLPNRLRQSQPTFELTGGLHAAGLFNACGELLSLREDVGRHNAVDKLIGAEFLASRLPLSRKLLCVSGRASFELVQKAVAAGCSALVAVGAPSSLAVELSERFGLTLIGFTRNERFNVYAGRQRLIRIGEPGA